MDKKLANTAFVLSLIGGILGMILGFFAFIGGFVLLFAGRMTTTSIIPGWLMMIISVYVLITSIIVIVAAVLIRKPKTCLTGSILTLIFSIFGAGTIFGMIGGILGIVASQK